MTNQGDGTTGAPRTAPTSYEVLFDGPIRFYMELGIAIGEGSRLRTDAETALKLAQDYGDVYIDLDAALRDSQAGGEK